MKNSILIFVLSLIFACVTAQNSEERIVIDERMRTETILNSFVIDQVWSGHPVGFSLLTHNSRQYIAYYNANRNMVVGQRNLNEENFSLHIMPPTYQRFFTWYSF